MRRPLYVPALLALLATPALAQDDTWIQTRLIALDELFGDTVNLMAAFLFADFGTGFPLIVGVLLGGGIYYSFYFKWLSIRGFRHAIDVLRGRYDDPKDPGEITHFQALSSALSATIGLGNIAGVAIAVSLGGPGAVFWMIVTAVFGMSSKLASCTLAIMYRRTTDDGHVSGGPMYYLEKGLALKGKAEFGRTLAVIYAFLTIGGSFGGGNMFQANQTLEILSTVSPWFKDNNWIMGLIMAFFVGLVIIGGIRRIGSVTSKIVPAMCVLYVVSSLFIILMNVTQVPAMLVRIVSDAFTGPAMYGGFFGVLVMGIRRAAFSNEAGMGTEAMAHGAARTGEPVREGLVAMLGPMIDTLIVCTLTGLVILVTGVWQEGGEDGVLLTTAAFSSGLGAVGPYVLLVCVLFFSFSSMIGYSYYVTKCATFLFGSWARVPTLIFYLVAILVSAFVSLDNVINFMDIMFGMMAVPTILSTILLAPRVMKAFHGYVERQGLRKN